MLHLKVEYYVIPQDAFTQLQHTVCSIVFCKAIKDNRKTVGVSLWGHSHYVFRSSAFYFS